MITEDEENIEIEDNSTQRDYIPKFQINQNGFQKNQFNNQNNTNNNSNTRYSNSMISQDQKQNYTQNILNSQSLGISQSRSTKQFANLKIQHSLEAGKRSIEKKYTTRDFVQNAEILRYDNVDQNKNTQYQIDILQNEEINQQKKDFLLLDEDNEQEQKVQQFILSKQQEEYNSQQIQNKNKVSFNGANKIYWVSVNGKNKMMNAQFVQLDPNSGSLSQCNFSKQTVNSTKTSSSAKSPAYSSMKVKQKKINTHKNLKIEEQSILMLRKHKGLAELKGDTKSNYYNSNTLYDSKQQFETSRINSTKHLKELQPYFQSPSIQTQRYQDQFNESQLSIKNPQQQTVNNHKKHHQKNKHSQIKIQQQPVQQQVGQNRLIVSGNESSTFLLSEFQKLNFFNYNGYNTKQQQEQQIQKNLKKIKKQGKFVMPTEGFRTRLKLQCQQDNYSSNTNKNNNNQNNSIVNENDKLMTKSDQNEIIKIEDNQNQSQQQENQQQDNNKQQYKDILNKTQSHSPNKHKKFVQQNRNLNQSIYFQPTSQSQHNLSHIQHNKTQNIFSKKQNVQSIYNVKLNKQ